MKKAMCEDCGMRMDKHRLVRMNSGIVWVCPPKPRPTTAAEDVITHLESFDQAA